MYVGEVAEKMAARTRSESVAKERCLELEAFAVAMPFKSKLKAEEWRLQLRLQ